VFFRHLVTVAGAPRASVDQGKSSVWLIVLLSRPSCDRGKRAHVGLDSRRVPGIGAHFASVRRIAFNEDGIFRRYKALAPRYSGMRHLAQARNP
jgi:hypothetical protein